MDFRWLVLDQRLALTLLELWQRPTEKVERLLCLGALIRSPLIAWRAREVLGMIERTSLYWRFANALIPHVSSHRQRQTSISVSYLPPRGCRLSGRL